MYLTALVEKSDCCVWPVLLCHWSDLSEAVDGQRRSISKPSSRSESLESKINLACMSWIDEGITGEPPRYRRNIQTAHNRRIEPGLFCFWVKSGQRHMQPTQGAETYVGDGTDHMCSSLNLQTIGCTTSAERLASLSSKGWSDTHSLRSSQSPYLLSQRHLLSRSD